MLSAGQYVGLENVEMEENKRTDNVFEPNMEMKTNQNCVAQSNDTHVKNGHEGYFIDIVKLCLSLHHSSYPLPFWQVCKLCKQQYLTGVNLLSQALLLLYPWAFIKCQNCIQEEEQSLS